MPTDHDRARGPVFSVDAHGATAAMFGATETTIQVVTGNPKSASALVKFEGAGIVTVASHGKISAVKFHGSYSENAGMSLLASATGNFSSGPVQVFVAAHVGDGDPEVVLALTNLAPLKLGDFPFVTQMQGIDDLPTLDPDSTIAMVALPRGGGSLLGAAEAAIRDIDGPMLDAPGTGSGSSRVLLNKLRLALITDPMAGVVVAAQFSHGGKDSSPFHDSMVPLNEFIPHEKVHRIGLQGHINPAAQRYELYLDLVGTAHFACSSIATIESSELHVSITRDHNRVQVQFSGDGWGTLKQVQTLQDRFPLHIEGSLGAQGRLIMKASGKASLYLLVCLVSIIQFYFTYVLHSCRCS